MVLKADHEDTKMPKRGHTEEQIQQALRQAESGAKAVEVCRRMGISNKRSTPRRGSMRGWD